MKSADWPALDGIPDRALEMFTIYDHPLDYPQFWVVRRCFGVAWEEGMPGRPAEPLHAPGEAVPVFDVVPRLATSLAEARSFVPVGLYRQPRCEGEDFTIVETWF